MCQQAADVLIETLWNVKENMLEDMDVSDHGINRNIVECKVSTVRVGNVQIIRY